ncbi:MAG: hypothetical protein JWR80_1537 [Bradyrhizobium sp.]|nr:hypothetical protein [Bradyrhizobium sp.]
MRKGFMGLAAFAAAFATSSAHASENGGRVYPNGAEAFGPAAVPPPGQYLINYTEYYGADRLNDDDGKKVPIDFHLDAEANVFRFINVTSINVLGGHWAQHAFIPIARVSVDIGGQRQRHTGLGDIIVDPFLIAWNKGNTFWAVGTDIFIPTGDYSPTRLANTGRNYWTFEPVFAFTHYNPRKGGLDVSFKLMYDFNTVNKATNYRSGNVFHTDFGLSYDFRPLSVGIGGYYYSQTNADKVSGARVNGDGYRGEIFALGPILRYQLGKVPVMLHYQHEFLARNQPQGDTLWLKLAFRL